MKLLNLAFVLALGLTAVHANAFDQGDNQQRQTPAMSLKGDWDMIRHECSSGAPPADPFMPSRDRVRVIFRENTFSTRVDQAQCSTWTDGQYWLQDQRLLTLRFDQIQSNCNVNRPPVQQVTYSIDFKSNEEFALYIGPVDGGSCPRGDLIINTYRRY